MTTFKVTRRTVLGGMAATAGMLAAPALVRASTPFKVAIAAPMTGSSGAMGLNGDRGATMAVKAINDAGGIAGREVVFEIHDDRGTPKDAALVAQQIIQNPDYFCVIGHVNSSCTLAAMPIYSEANMPVLNNSSSNAKITEQGWQNFIRMTLRDDYASQQYAAFLINNLQRKKIAVFHVNNDFGRGLRDNMVKAIDALGATLVAEGTFTPNVTRDFQPVISQMKASGADGVFLGTEYTEGGLFLAQAKDLGFVDGIAYVGPDANLYDKFIELSLGAAEGKNVMAAFDPYAPAPVTQNLMGAFRTQYNSLPSQVAVFTYDLFNLLKIAVEQKGATKENLIATIKGMTYDGAGGHFAWSEKGDPKDRSMAVITIKDGQFASTGIQVDQTGLDKLRG
ncbi:ABC transporter substrate-binding protein [Segnochrobactraceae bacterium EtOH-i3]